jgi:hypothetical protein
VSAAVLDGDGADTDSVVILDGGGPATTYVAGNVLDGGTP